MVNVFLFQNKIMSAVGFEPTPTFVDQNALSRCEREGYNLESGALDHSAMLTDIYLPSYVINMCVVDIVDLTLCNI